MNRKTNKTMQVFYKRNIILMAILNILTLNWAKNQKYISKGLFCIAGRELAHMYEIKDLCDTSKVFY
jgi:surface polysaccharide O-acyltransferase-like enzyme